VAGLLTWAEFASELLPRLLDQTAGEDIEFRKVLALRTWHPHALI
jgi:hypothetical protein